MPPSPRGTERCSALMTPTVTEGPPTSSMGQPMAMTCSPTRRSWAVPRMAVGKGPSPSILITAMSVSGSEPMTRPVNSRPLSRRTRTEPAVPTTEALVSMWPSLRKTMPEPTTVDVPARRTWATAARARSATSTTSTTPVVTASIGRGSICRSMAGRRSLTPTRPTVTITSPVASSPALTADTAATSHIDGRASSVPAPAPAPAPAATSGTPLRAKLGEARRPLPTGAARAGRRAGGGSGSGRVRPLARRTPCLESYRGCPPGRSRPPPVPWGGGSRASVRS